MKCKHSAIRRTECLHRHSAVRRTYAHFNNESLIKIGFDWSHKMTIYKISMNVTVAVCFAAIFIVQTAT